MIKMKNKDLDRSVLQFALHCAVRRTLKSVTGFLAGAPGLVIMFPPDGREPADYVRAVNHELYGEKGFARDDCGSMLICDVDTRKIVFSRFESECRSKARAVVIAENPTCVPKEIQVASDAILAISPISPTDLVAACNTVLGIDATVAQATEALTFPEPLLLAALRHGRPMDEVLQKLRATLPSVDEPKPAAVVKRLEAMHGYGAAREWGLQLARDLADWRAGIISWDDVDRGILLSGPPGVGKTAFAKALAAQCDVPLIASSLSRWQSKGHLGDLLKAMRADFAKAKEDVPCILFIDELDSFGDRNKFHHEHANYSIQVVNGFLECLDGVDGRDGVVIIGASNHPSRIDAALLRAGRFDNHIAISLPDNQSRIAILSEELDLQFQDEEVDKLTTLTSGFSGADLVKVCRYARRVARKQKRSVVAADVFASLSPLFKIEGDYRRAAAIHEAGHALVGWRLGTGRFLGAVIADYVDPRASSSQIGAAMFEYRRIVRRTGQDHLDRIAALLAGMAAEAVVLGEYGDGCGGSEGSDLDVATTLATLMEAQNGLGDRLRYSMVADATDCEVLRRSDLDLAAQVESTLREQFERAREMIERDRVLLEAIAKTLVDHGQISPEGLQKLASVRAKRKKVTTTGAPADTFLPGHPAS